MLTHACNFHSNFALSTTNSLNHGTHCTFQLYGNFFMEKEIPNILGNWIKFIEQTQ